MADECEVVTIADDEDMENCDSPDCIIVETDQQKSERLKAEGNKEYAGKNYYKAVRLYTEAIDLNPDSAPYYANRAAAYMMIQKYVEALEDTRVAIKMDENFVKAHFRCAKCHIALGSANSAIRQLEKVQELDPKNKQIFEELKNARAIQQFESSAFEAYDKEDFRKVLFCMDRACALSPACYMFKVMKAEALALLGRFSEAQIEANSVLRQDPCNIDAIYVRGVCLYYEGSEDKAFQHFTQVLNRDPDHKRAKTFRKKAKGLLTTKEAGNKAFGCGKYQEAYELYTQALTMDPNNKSTNAKLHYNRALVSAKLRNLEESIKDCTEAVELDATYLKAFHKRAKCYMDLEQYEEAVRDYEKISKIDRSRENKRLLQDAKLELKKSKRKDYYKVLGVPKDSSDDQIKKGYRKEALKHHPDRHSNADDEMKKSEEQLFKEVNEAYSVLSDPKKRGAYDRGEDLDDGGMGDFDANNIFQAFFGGGGGSPFMFNMGGGGGGGPGYHSHGGHSHGGHSHGHHGHPGGFSYTFG